MEDQKMKFKVGDHIQFHTTKNITVTGTISSYDIHDDTYVIDWDWDVENCGYDSIQAAKVIDNACVLNVKKGRDEV